MNVARTIEDMRALRRGWPSLGLVPTMGFLHAGHLSLVRRAKSECAAAAVSIFVNPTQFAAGGDFSRYPRNLEGDLALLEAEGADVVFAPSAEAMYPSGFDTVVRIGGVTEGLEGASRPGHFDGVATVVTKLLNIVQPTAAYFGRKDAQQVAVVEKLVKDLDIDVRIVAAATVRDADGLALSSRNAYLGAADRAAAPVLYRALKAAESLAAAGEDRAVTLAEAMWRVLRAEPRAQTEYVSIADPLTLRETDRLSAAGALASLAVRVGPARLIDNLMLHPGVGPRPGPLETPDVNPKS